ncbi:MAG: metallophosphoesterase family protein [Pseudomonadota bacterium]|nr:metallophosphoesterase family protein [Pseudomonadota bacterium]
MPRAGLPAGAVAYAIGDIHGRADLLDRLLQSIRADCADPGAATVVFLGDYVDRGDDSRDVIDLCLAFGRDWPGEVVFLRGNHEAALLTFLDDPESGQRWLEFGGMPTLMSYGVPDVAAPMSGERLARASDAFRSRLPAEHLDFLERTVLSYRMGGTFFCHAMIDAGFAADEQPAEVLMWGGRTRTPPRDWPYLVVHGHTIVERPVLSAREVNVDTGAYYSGRLTAARLSGDGVELLQT